MSKSVNLKLAVYGEGAVGKTSLVNLFIGKEVPETYSPTINSKVSKTDYILKKTGVTFKLNIWDVGGNRAINPIINNAFFSDVDLALLVFDLSRPELTLKSHRKNFLDRINRYSEEPLTLIVGNKLDKLLINNDFKTAVQNYLGEKKSFSITSATSELNVTNCFELLIYTFLKKAEILQPDLVPENSSLEFIELIGKTEEELRGHLVNLNSIDQKHRDLQPRIKKVDIPSQEEDKEKKYHEFIQQELIKISNQKGNLTDKFLENITEMERKLNQLKKQNIKSSPEVVEKLKISVESSKKNCEQQLETLIKLNREEKELLIISSKVREDKLADLPKKVLISQKIKESTPRSKLPKVKVKPKPQPKPLEVKTKTKTKLRPKLEEIKVKSQPKLKSLEVKTKVEPKPVEDKMEALLKLAEVKTKPEPELKPVEVKAKSQPEPKPVEVKAKSQPEPKPVEVKSKSQPEPKPAEVKVKPKPKSVPKPIEVKAKSQPGLKPLEVKAKSQPEPKPVEVKAKSPPKLKPVEVKAKVQPEPKPPEVKVKLQPVPKPLEDKAKLKSVPKLHEVKAKLKPVPKSPEIKVKAKPKPKPSKLKEVKIVSKPIKKDPKIESYNEYESINPGKRAVYRGKETKGFLEWKKNQKS